MKEYPSISGSKLAPIGQQCIVFNKYDGSNLSFEWSKKRGWYKYATRRRFFDKDDPDFGCAIEIFHKKYAYDLAKILTDFPEFKKPQSATVFCEFVGPHSFAGWHTPEQLASIGIKVDNNDPKDLMLFDVNIYKRGFVSPRNFVNAFGHLHVAEVIYDGILTEEFIKEVREGKCPVKEGVVCKGGDGFNHTLWMAKIKTEAYIQELKDRFGVGWKQYGE
jgi:hypothetical protein